MKAVVCHFAIEDFPESVYEVDFSGNELSYITHNLYDLVFANFGWGNIGYILIIDDNNEKRGYCRVFQDHHIYFEYDGKVIVNTCGYEKPERKKRSSKHDQPVTLRHAG